MINAKGLNRYVNFTIDHFVKPKSGSRTDMIEAVVKSRIVEWYVTYLRKKRLNDEDTRDYIQECYCQICRIPEEKWQSLYPQGMVSTLAYVAVLIKQQVVSSKSAAYLHIIKPKKNEVNMTDNIWAIYEETNTMPEEHDYEIPPDLPEDKLMRLEEREARMDGYKRKQNEYNEKQRLKRERKEQREQNKLEREQRINEEKRIKHEKRRKHRNYVRHRTEYVKRKRERRWANGVQKRKKTRIRQNQVGFEKITNRYHLYRRIKRVFESIDKGK